jgi:hypothetical protein
MIAALLTALFLLHGDGFAVELFAKYTQTLVSEVVTDQTRAAAAVETIKQGRKDLEATVKQFEKIAKAFDKTDKVQSAGLDELTPFLQQASEQRRVGQAVSLDRVIELRKTLTEEEWNAIFAKLK